MRFWDASALTPLVIQEPTTGSLRLEFERDRALVYWWGTPVECASAIARRVRDGDLVDRGAHRELDTLLGNAAQIDPSEFLRERARELARIHPLRASDALQLAAGLVWIQGRPAGAIFVCLDQRLRVAAQREGFDVLPA